jgi:uncharacterized heparinase superfamily protein
MTMRGAFSNSTLSLMQRRIMLYYHTLCHLKLVQLAWRLILWLRPPCIDLADAPPMREPRRPWIAACARKTSMTGPDTFRFLNAERRIANAADWNAGEVDKLWLYNAHYFDDLGALDSMERSGWHQQLIERWIIENPPSHGNGWEPYPLSLRIVNWIKFALSSGTLNEDARQSLAIQVRYLGSRLEYHLLGNHLLANAKALIFAGTWFAGAESERWLERGLTILRRELPEQVLNDGGHFERSPMYHGIILEDLLDLHNLMQTYELESRLPALPLVAMRTWLRALCHPDGGIAFFNDAAFGIAPDTAEIEAYAARLGMPGLDDMPTGLTQLCESGYIRLEAGPALALLDVAPVGPDYLPGHAHADTLSFELSIFGSRMFVNSGTSCYKAGAQREFERSTAAHNTLNIDGADSSEMWSSFRVARRARPMLEEVAVCEHEVCVTASHNGYRRLRGGNTHRRTWCLKRNMLEICDEILGEFTQAQVYFHLHPSVMLVEIEQGRLARLRLDGVADVVLRVLGGALKAEAGQWHSEFGLSQPSTRLVVRLEGAHLVTDIEWNIPS